MEFKKLKISLLATLCLFVSSSQALTIISDLDDTIKVTNTRNFRAAAYNAVFSTKAYLGMPQLMEELREYSAGLYYVSASPRLLTSRIQRFFKKNEMKVDGFYSRSLRQLGEKKLFKIAAIKDILDKTADEVVLIGDDSQEDEEIYRIIKAEYPDLVKAVYIHNVYNVSPTSKAMRFFSAFDIAVAEYEAQRMTFEQVASIAKTILKSKQMEQIFPMFAYCPTKLSEFNSPPLSKVSPLSLAVSTKIIAYCNLRSNMD